MMARYLNLQELAVYTGLSKSFLEKKIPEIPHYRIGRRVLFEQLEIDAWMSQFKVKPGGEDTAALVDEIVKQFQKDE